MEGKAAEELPRRAWSSRSPPYTARARTLARQRPHDGGGNPALWPAWSQNESGVSLILRTTGRWRWGVSRAPRRLCLPHPCRVSRVNAQHAVPGRCRSARRAMWHNTCSLAASLCACLTRPRGVGCRGDRKRLCGMTHRQDCSTFPMHRQRQATAWLLCTEACLCDGPFSQWLLASSSSGG